MLVSGKRKMLLALTQKMEEERRVPRTVGGRLQGACLGLLLLLNNEELKCHILLLDLSSSAVDHVSSDMRHPELEKLLEAELVSARW